MRTTLLFSTAIFSSAVLLFWIQPLFAKMILPFLGGSPAVWNTAMVFYQSLLLGGYLYAHLLSRVNSGKRQLLIHVALLAVPIVFLPPSPFEIRLFDETSSPVLWTLLLMLVSIGPPFFVLSSTAPLLQHWYVKVRQGSDPYFLYAYSNAGSLGVLLAFPLLLEVNFSLRGQAYGWAALYAIFACAMAACALLQRRAPNRPVETSTAVDVSNRTRLRWIVLSFIPSSLLLGVTMHLTTELLTVPLLWVIPLALYLLTFVVAFSTLPIDLARLSRYAVIFLLPLALWMAMGLQAREYRWIPAILHLAVFTLLSLLCHVRLNRLRPPSSVLTEYFLLISVGGVLGGAFNSFVAPLLFNSIFEYPLMLAIAPLFAFDTSREKIRSITIKTAICVFTAAALISAQHYVETAFRAGVAKDLILILTFGIAAVLTLVFARIPPAFAVLIAFLVFTGHTKTLPNHELLYRERTFFGTHSVMKHPGGLTILMHGNTVHGAQLANPVLRSVPTTYYTFQGPLGQVFREYISGDSDARVGVVGLGAGTIAAYGEPGQIFTFLELDPTVIRLAQDTTYFTFLSEGAADHRIIPGDARLTLQRDASLQFDLLVIDAFSSDAIPVHLLTKEAMELYRNRLAPGGILALHLSNRYLNLAPLALKTARSIGMKTIYQQHDGTRSAQAGSLSIWVVAAEQNTKFKPLLDSGRWQARNPDPQVEPWTDDYSNLFSVFVF